MTQSSIHSRALLVWLTISTWSARKYDRKVSDEVNRQHNASSDAGRYNKFLLPGDAASYKTLVTLAGSIRAQHYADTLAWSDEGWRLLPTANYLQYTATFRKRAQEFQNALDEFVADYPLLRDRARVKLNGLFRDEDYPSAQDIRQRFALNVEYAPVPADGDLRVDLSSDQIGEIETAISNRVERAVGIAVQDSWQRLYTVVGKISERLNTPDAIFRDSLIENAADLCDTLKRLNVTDDPDLEAMRVRVLRDLTRVSPETLRENKSARDKVAKSADQIMAAMASFYVPDQAA